MANIFCYLLIGLVMIISLPSSAKENNQAIMSTAFILPQFTQYAEQVRKDWEAPGMAVAIVQNDKIIYIKGFGQRNTKAEAVTPDTVFGIGSITKSFTAALLATQIDEGKYGWNTKVVKLDPQFKLYDSNTTKAFEVRDLLAHDSGLPEEALDALAGNFGYSPEHNMYALRFIKPVAPFRTQFAYQDTLLEFAKKIIEQISGKSFAENLHEHIFNPLQMNHSYLTTEVALKQLHNIAEPYTYYQNKNYTFPKTYPYLSQRWALQQGLAGGGIKSSACDIAKWLIFNMNNGAINNKQLISAQNMDFIHSPQTLIKSSARDVNLKDNTQQAYGEGWFIDKETYKPYNVLYHAGSDTGMHGMVAYIPDIKIGIVILTNQYTNKVPEALYRRFFDLYLNKLPLKDWSKFYLDERANDTKQNAMQKQINCQANKNISLKKYTGIYNNSVYGDLIMSKQKNHLLLSIGPQQITWILTPCQTDIFKAYWPNPGMDIPMLPSGQDLVKFSTKPNGSVNEMEIPFLNNDGSGVFVKK